MLARTRRRSLVRLAAAAVALTAATACASGGGGAASEPAAGAVAANVVWPIKTREHVDLWLHAFALVQDDTSQVPFFRRGYRDRLTVVKNQAKVVTALDRQRDTLRLWLRENPGLVSGQFAALSFENYEELRRAIQIFFDADGVPQRARNEQEARAIGVLSGYFPNRGDREFLRRFVAGVDDERDKFYHNYWVAQQQEHATTLAAIDSLWQRQLRPKLQRYLNNTQQQNGEMVLSFPLDGEGRTVLSGRGTFNTIVVTFPDRPADAAEALYVFTHEAAAQVAALAINDNVTPTQQRLGAADRLVGPAAVRGGLMLLERAAPELADGYARYYLRSANRAVPATNPRAALVTAFPLPTEIVAAFTRQLDVVLGGI